MEGANWTPERPGGSTNPGLTSGATPVLECCPRPSAHRSRRSGALRTTTTVGPNCDQQSPCAGAPRSTARQRIGGAAEEPAKERCAAVHPSPRTLLISAPTCEMDLRRSATSQQRKARDRRSVCAAHATRGTTRRAPLLAKNLNRHPRCQSTAAAPQDERRANVGTRRPPSFLHAGRATLRLRRQAVSA